MSDIVIKYFIQRNVFQPWPDKQQKTVVAEIGNLALKGGELGIAQ
jgi:hypothetical protein